MATGLDGWMARYQVAWESNAPGDVAALFAPEAEYRSYPWAEPARGHEAIVALWERTADAPGDHTFAWHPVGGGGGRHFVQGHTVYADGRTYENLWIVDLDDAGLATAFTEWYMESASKPLGPNG